MKPVENPPTDVGVIVGRFQVDALHEGHRELIDHVTNLHSKVIIFLGISQLKCTYNNPLDYESRQRMIQTSYPDVVITYIKNMRYDEQWSKTLDERISDMIGPNKTVTLYGGRDSFISHYSGKHKCVELVQAGHTSGSQIRSIISNKVRDSVNFRAGVIWATRNQFVNATPCADVAIFNEDYTKILLGKKSNEDKYRFVGGHVDPGETYEHAAKREGTEETGLELDCFEYIGSFAIKDWRHKGEKSGITTAFFKAKRIYGITTPQDDIDALEWFEFGDIFGNEENILMPEHAKMFGALWEHERNKNE